MSNADAMTPLRLFWESLEVLIHYTADRCRHTDDRCRPTKEFLPGGETPNDSESKPDLKKTIIRI